MAVNFIMSMKKITIIAVIFAVAFAACKKYPIPPATTVQPSFTNLAKGADVSWLTQMEAAGIKFYDNSNTAQDCIQLLGTLGINSIRLRVWVNPSGGWCNTADVVAKAIRAKKAGMKILIDFHYSDTWADPANQTKPAAWQTQDFATLQTSVYTHTVSVLNALKTAGITPDWVQVGNETNNGMLWPDGMASANMANFAKLITAGYNGVKSVSTSTKVIVHLSNGYDTSLFKWMFDGLKANNASYDVIGMSLYPTAANWLSYNQQCLVNMNNMITRYSKEVMICEVGMSVTSAADCKSFITDLLTKVNSLPGNKGLGVFYWEPEAYNNWQGYGLGAFGNNGVPTVAMNAFY